MKRSRECQCPHPAFPIARLADLYGCAFGIVLDPHVIGDASHHGVPHVVIHRGISIFPELLTPFQVAAYPPSEPAGSRLELTRPAVRPRIRERRFARLRTRFPPCIPAAPTWRRWGRCSDGPARDSVSIA